MQHQIFEMTKQSVASVNEQIQGNLNLYLVMYRPSPTIHSSAFLSRFPPGFMWKRRIKIQESRGTFRVINSGFVILRGHARM